MLSLLPDSTAWKEFSNTSNQFPIQLLAKVRQLPIRYNEILKMVDFDDTLWNSARRYAVDRQLENHRWDLAIAYIRKAYGTEMDPTWLHEFVTLLEVDNHLFETDEFYEPKNPNHVILTAGHPDLQRLKIESAGYTYAKRILVRDAKNKPLEILRYVVKLWYIPGKIEFIDDRIDNFAWMDDLLAEILRVSVIFQKAIPDLGNSTVKLVCMTEKRMQDIIPANDSTIQSVRRVWD